MTHQIMCSWLLFVICWLLTIIVPPSLQVNPCVVQSFFMNAGAFLIQVRQELKKVTWPTRAEVVQMTTLVIIVSLAVGIYIGVIDVALTKAIETVVK